MVVIFVHFWSQGFKGFIVIYKNKAVVRAMKFLVQLLYLQMQYNYTTIQRLKHK